MLLVLVAAAAAASAAAGATVTVTVAVAAQVTLLKSLLRGYNGVKVSTVDGYQGSEKDIVLLSFVRCGGGSSVGFLRDFRRLNVALTRARNALILLGHAATLQQQTGSSIGTMMAMLKALGLVHPEDTARQLLQG